MIDKKTYSIAQIESISKQHKKVDKILIEKSIRALILLWELKSNGLNFIFKGGTALMLRFRETKRLSIDIDIIISNIHANLVQIFKQIINQGHFIRFELHQRNINSDISKTHYKFFYNPSHKTHSSEEYNLLDILFERNPYQKLIQTPILSPFLIIQSEPEKVSVPSFGDIVGDKLTAFAPNTTGISYFKSEHSMSMEILKQLYGSFLI